VIRSFRRADRHATSIPFVSWLGYLIESLTGSNVWALLMSCPGSCRVIQQFSSQAAICGGTWMTRLHTCSLAGRSREFRSVFSHLSKRPSTHLELPDSQKHKSIKSNKITEHNLIQLECQRPTNTRCKDFCGFPLQELIKLSRDVKSERCSF